MRTIHQNAMSLLEYLYRHNAGYVSTITGNQMRQGCKPTTDEEYRVADQYLVASGYVEACASPNGGNYHMTPEGIRAMEEEINSRSVWKRRGDDIVLVVLAGLLGILGTLAGTLLGR